MSVVRAALIYFFLMFCTIFSWFALGQYMVRIFIILFGVATSPNAQEAIKNCILGTHLTFIALLACWTIWFVYVINTHEVEQSYYGGGF